MISTEHIGVCFAISLLSPTGVLAAKPDAGAIGGILGFPAEQLIITDVTDVERKIYSMPTFSEVGPVVPPHLRSRTRGNDHDVPAYKPVIPPESIIESYRITGKTEYSFFPLLMTIAKKGTFLSKEYTNMVEKLAAVPLDVKEKANFTHLGRITVDGVGSGGVIIGEVRTPSPVKEMTYPGSRMALIAELRMPDRGVDVRIAMFAALDGRGNSPLIEVPGGERYHAHFRGEPGGYEDPLPKAPKFDWTQGFGAIFSEVHRALTPKAGAAAQPREQLDGLPEDKQLLQVQGKGQPPENIGFEPKMPSSGGVLVGVLVIAVIIGLLWLLRKIRK